MPNRNLVDGIPREDIIRAMGLMVSSDTTASIQLFIESILCVLPTGTLEDLASELGSESVYDTAKELHLQRKSLEAEGNPMGNWEDDE